MGFKNADLHPTQITSTTPPGKAELHKIINIPIGQDVVPTDGAVAVLPANSTVIGAHIYHINTGTGVPAGEVMVGISRKSTDILNPNSGAELIGGFTTSDLSDLQDTGNAIMTSVGRLPNINKNNETDDLLVSLNTENVDGDEIVVILKYIQ